MMWSKSLNMLWSVLSSSFLNSFVWFAEGMNTACRECLKNWQVVVSHRETEVWRQSVSTGVQLNKCRCCVVQKKCILCINLENFCCFWWILWKTYSSTKVVTLKVVTFFDNFNANTHHFIMAIFPGKPGLTSYPVDSSESFWCRVLWSTWFSGASQKKTRWADGLQLFCIHCDSWK